MILLPYLLCKTCPAHISLPLPIRSDTTPHQIAFPWGALDGTFLCVSCRQPNHYWAEDCRWDRVQSTDLNHKFTPEAVHQIDIPCGVERCPGLLHILAVMPKASCIEDAARLIGHALLLGTPCDSGHPNRGLLTHRAIRCTALSVTKQGDTLEWAT